MGVLPFGASLRCAAEAAIALVLLFALCVAFGSQNALSPNLTQIAATFHFDEGDRDFRVGGALAFLYYVPGCLGAVAVAALGSAYSRGILLCAVLFVAALSSLLTFFVQSYAQLCAVRVVSGLSLGGAHPLAYALVADLFIPDLRSLATACVLCASGFGAFLGQLLAAVLGGLGFTWQLVFLVLAPPLFAAVALYAPLVHRASQQERANNNSREELHHRLSLHFGSSSAGGDALPERSAEFPASPACCVRCLRKMLNSKTNIFMLLQAFPGNIPWGILFVYLHDFLCTDIGLPSEKAIAAVVGVAVASFLGLLTGGLVGGRLTSLSGKALLRFCAVACVFRCVPCVMVFSFPLFASANPEGASLAALIFLLLVGAFTATLPTANVGAVILNVNSKENRSSMCSLYSILDDLSKASGGVVASLLARLVGSRAVAFQIAMSAWILSGAALLAAGEVYEGDRRRAQEADEFREKGALLQVEFSEEHFPLLFGGNANARDTPPRGPKEVSRLPSSPASKGFDSETLVAFDASQHRTRL